MDVANVGGGVGKLVEQRDDIGERREIRLGTIQEPTSPCLGCDGKLLPCFDELECLM